MNIQILGAHNCETKHSRFISLLIDEVVVIDAGGLTSSLSFDAQKNIRAILLTHKHYDHIKDIPSIAINLYFHGAGTTIYSTHDIYKALTDHLLNGIIYPNYFNIPATNSTLKYNAIEAGKAVEIEGYTVLPIKMNHEETTVGYQVSSHDKKSMFYTSDTGKDLSYCWEHISPQLLLIEVTLSNRFEDFALKTNHLTPKMLLKELKSFLKIKGYLPSVIAMHMRPDLEEEIQGELEEAAKHLNTSIKIAAEGMQIQI